MTHSIRLIVGLGNPGAQYEETRHNVGAWFIHQYAAKENATFKLESKFHGMVTRLQTESGKSWLLEPMTFMNDSGRAVVAIAKFYKIAVNEILIAHDELDFPAGKIRLKETGGHGGHNGLRDIIHHLGSKDFLRLRIGIGHPGHRDKVTPHVLGRPSKADEDKIMDAIDQAITILPDLETGNIQKAFRTLNAEADL